MKYVLIFSFSIFSFSVISQITTGANHFSFNGVVLNGENKQLENYPVYTDTTETDTIVYAGLNSVNLQLGYHVAVARNLSFGINSRFLCSEGSSYRINSGGLSLRYYFNPFRTYSDRSEKREEKDR